ncbi:MAG: nucleotidyltransferase family protein, partial [Patescibacteria group bacterium]
MTSKISKGNIEAMPKLVSGQAVILAAGRGTRMGSLTETTPKALLEVAGKTLLEYKLEAMPDNVDEIIIVVGHLGEMIRKRFGDSYRGKQLLYVEENNPVGGTAHSLWLARDILRDRFLVMNGDNIYARSDMETCANSAKDEWAVLVKEKTDIPTGRVVVDGNGFVTDIVEKNLHSGESGFANTGLYALDMRIFDYPQVSKSPSSGELGLPQTMIQAVKNINIRAVPAAFWIEIKTPEDLK